jgi:hypothetical protein
LAVISGSVSKEGVLGFRSCLGMPNMTKSIADAAIGLRPLSKYFQKIQLLVPNTRPNTWNTGSSGVLFAALFVKISDC